MVDVTYDLVQLVSGTLFHLSCLQNQEKRIILCNKEAKAAHGSEQCRGLLYNCCAVVQSHFSSWAEIKLLK